MLTGNVLHWHMQTLIDAVTAGHALNESQIETATTALLDQGRSANHKVQFLKALHKKGESPEEIALFVQAFLGHARVPSLTQADVEGPMIDVCGTGGDKLDLFNVSTTSIFVLAAGGLTVVKHGNRGITSKSGGADVLEALGISIELQPDAFTECVKRHGLAFLFAPLYHPAFKAVVPARKLLAEQGQKTIFNLLGPLLNPVRPPYQLIGVFDEALPPVYARILDQLGRQEAWAVHGKTADGRGVDEISSMGPTSIHRTRARQGQDTWNVTPESLGLTTPDLADLQGGDAKHNALILEGILSGEEQGPKRDIVLLNAGAGFAITGVASDLASGIAKAAEVISSGAALQKLRCLQD